jgi:uncharacterized protein YbjT (DUF2867 family)
VRVLLTGANGFIGAAVLARLKAEGHQVVAVARSSGASVRRLPADAFAHIDISRATSSPDWLPHLKNIDALVNCAGSLQDGPRDSIRGVHVDGVSALFEACEQASVRRIIHISAIGVDRNTPTAFSATKQEGEAALMARNLDWVILRPSVVLGRAAFGGSALMRGLAALPTLPIAQGWAPLQVVQLDDLTHTISFFLDPAAPSRIALDIAGPERLSFADVVGHYRSWFGWPKARILHVPGLLFDIAFRLGDLAGFLGWRSPIRSTAGKELKRGAVGDNTEWRRLTGIEPKSLSQALAAEPASVQERWFAALYPLKPLGFIVFALFWIGTGLISLGPGWQIGVSYLREGGIAEPYAPLLVIAGALADIAIGIGIAFRRSARIALYAAVAISVFYFVAGTIVLPRLWLDPLGPMLKIWPIMALNLMLLAIREDR